MRILILGLLCFLGACSQELEESKKGGSPAVVTVFTVQSQPWTEVIQAVGTSKARDSVVIAAKQSERVSAVHFDSGQRVAKGRLLVELDSGTARAELQEAQASLNDLNSQVQRLQNLQSRQLIAKSQLDTVVANRNAARARVQAAQVRLDERMIRAPFSGVLGLRQVSPGQFVNAGAAMVNLDDLDRMWVDFPVPEFLLTKVETGMPLRLKADAYPDEDFPARVAGVESRVDVSTRALMVRAEVQNANGRLRPGMLMRVELQQALGESLVVPELCLQQVGNRSFVYAVNADNTVVSRDIRIGSRRNGMVVILSGLKAGDRIVLDGTSKLRDGQSIQIAPAGSSTKP